jgi:hypothetical protein
MSSTLITSGDLSNGAVVSSGNDGSVIIQSGLAGAKVNALVANPNGTLSLPSNAAPCFSAYQSTAQTALTATTNIKLLFQTKLFDTANAFDNTTNYRFQPLVAGYYQVNGAFQINGASSQVVIFIYKNGAQNLQGTQITPTSATVTFSSVSGLLFLNGSTDYIELYGYTASSFSPVAGPAQTYFQAALIRPA